MDITLHQPDGTTLMATITPGPDGQPPTRFAVDPATGLIHDETGAVIGAAVLSRN